MPARKIAPKHDACHGRDLLACAELRRHFKHRLRQAAFDTASPTLLGRLERGRHRIAVRITHHGEVLRPFDEILPGIFALQLDRRHRHRVQHETRIDNRGFAAPSPGARVVRHRTAFILQRHQRIDVFMRVLRPLVVACELGQVNKTFQFHGPEVQPVPRALAAVIGMVEADEMLGRLDDLCKPAPPIDPAPHEGRDVARHVAHTS